ncbi:hypothetical protein HDU76_011860 [Blyttiomyces sp. JEL0837]|nr:hypothetical protein HDU76_011860 [Blyttiomyces sp. JEL0837]
MSAHASKEAHERPRQGKSRADMQSSDSTTSTTLPPPTINHDFGKEKTQTRPDPISPKALSPSSPSSPQLPPQAPPQSQAALSAEEGGGGQDWIPPVKPLKVRVFDNIFIPLPGGLNLASRIWMPQRSGSDVTFPVILEFIPYRKRDYTAQRDEVMHAYFASRGYVSVRVDNRGTGESEGILEDEYTAQELEDAVAVIQFLARQPWSTGSPPELKAIVTVCSTDDRYADDIHHLGGYYKHGSICEDYGRIEVPVFSVGGWADSYTRPIFRMMENLQGPKKALIGPWGHLYPHQGLPTPSVNFLDDAIRWWDRWLKDDDNGISEEPPVQLYMQDAIEPSRFIHGRPGKWAALEAWPSQFVKVVSFTGNTATRKLSIAQKVSDTVASPPICLETNLKIGQCAARFMPFHGDPEFAPDQAADDELSLCFETEPLTEDLILLGSPEVEIRLSSSHKNAIIVARICDVDPDTGASTLIGWGPLNLTHRESHTNPTEVPINEPITVKVPIKHLSHRLHKSRVLRLALSTSYWPLVWPSPENPTLDIYQVDLKVLVYVGEDDEVAKSLKVSRRLFEHPRMASLKPFTELRPESTARLYIDDVKGRRVWYKDCGATRFDTDSWVFGESCTEAHTLRGNDPLSALVECEMIVECGRPSVTRPEKLAKIGLRGTPLVTESTTVFPSDDASNWKGLIRVEAMLRVSCTKSHFVVNSVLRVLENGLVIKDRIFEDVEIPRDLV